MIRFLRVCSSSDRLSHSPVTFPARLSFIHPSTIPSCTLSIHLYSYIYFCLLTSPYLSISHYLCHPVYVLYVSCNLFSICLSITCMSLCLSQSSSLSVSVNICLSVCVCAYLSFHLLIYLYLKNLRAWYSMVKEIIAGLQSLDKLCLTSAA